MPVLELADAGYVCWLISKIAKQQVEGFKMKKLLDGINATRMAANRDSVAKKPLGGHSHIVAVLLRKGMSVRGV